MARIFSRYVKREVPFLIDGAWVRVVRHEGQKYKVTIEPPVGFELQACEPPYGAEFKLVTARLAVGRWGDGKPIRGDG